MRNMSFALTVPQIQAGTKDVTRRMGWLHLKRGDLIQPVRKCMGLKPGETIERLRAPLLILDVRREPLDMMTTDLDYGLEEIRREGFADDIEHNSPIAWVSMFCASHKGCMPHSVVTRIEFAYT